MVAAQQPIIYLPTFSSEEPALATHCIDGHALTSIRLCAMYSFIFSFLPPFLLQSASCFVCMRCVSMEILVGR